ncbi:AAA family ATPase [Bifidobacterium pseudocatenulatum]|uniref:AAA family ATPase n=1 Tax=Bifidobacterium pseudocatenulatum TaxID=28026 RepID=UPI001F0F8954|nr:ATP-binding protein [Bifidobacterium pseudocatenulatum]MCH4843470.1 ATP-binding protein [Bifidobacterium pseudocatenulatum]
MKNKIIQLVKFGLDGKSNDFRMYVSRLVRKYRVSDAAFSKKLESLLHSTTAPETTSVRRVSREVRLTSETPVLRMDQLPDEGKPLLSEWIAKQIEEMLEEREKANILANNGLTPTSTAIFTGPPGVGKTMTAQWIARRLGLPMYRLDLAEAIGSHLGETGSNLKAAFSKIRDIPGILFLDEIDAIAKTRSDDSDIGEMKRVVTVLLQELDDRNPASLILAATNNAPLIDPAVWRRFEVRIDFPMPDTEQITQMLEKELDTSGNLGEASATWITALGLALKGVSFSEVKSTAMRIKKRAVLGQCSMEDAVIEYVRENADRLNHAQRIALAVTLVETGTVTQRLASDMTGVSRQTIRRRIEKAK